jgi:hypothetical protein
MQIEAGVDIAEVETRQVRDAAESIPQRAAVNMQNSSRFVVVAAAFQVVAKDIV